MSNVISFCDYRQKKLEEKTENDFYLEDLLGSEGVWPVIENLTTATFTVTIDDETFKVDLNDFE